MSNSIVDKIEDATTGKDGYIPFGTGQFKTDYENYYGGAGVQGKLDEFKKLCTNGTDPQFVLIMFFTTILAANDVPHGPFKGNGASEARNYENQLTGVSKELNYASSVRNAVSDLKKQLENGKGGSGSSDPNVVLNDVHAIQWALSGCEGPKPTLSNVSTWTTPTTTNWDKKWAPEIFQGSSDTFSQALTQISDVVGQVNSKYGGSFANLWDAAKKQGDTTAGSLIQEFTNATDTLNSAVGVQQNVLNTQLQDIESDYKSILSVVSQGMKSIFSVINNAIQKSNVS